MFRTNRTQQMSMTDSFLRLPEHVQKLVEKSWAKDFSEYIFPGIDEERFAVLYSENGSRPNTPVNVVVPRAMKISRPSAQRFHRRNL